MKIMIKHVFFDFNGTIIDDLDLCLELLNDILKKHDRPTVDIKRYKEIFTFPIKDYYIAAGVDFTKDSYEDLAIDFIKKYQPRSLKCGLFCGLENTFKELNELGISCYILSASQRSNLYEQCESFGIVKYFKDILGIDNIHAASKIHIGIDYIKESNIDPNEAIFVGDTTHDYEVATAMGLRCYLVECGHQSKNRLSEVNAPIISTTSDILDVVKRENKIF
jgi:phosphoglycolate phosphatase